MNDISIITSYFPALSENQQKQFARLGELYQHWNSQINVISRKDIDLLYEHHVLHSLAIAKIIRFKPQTKIMDVGTGGGFPGIPLAIMFPESDFYLVDSIGKKIKVVNEISTAIHLKNVRTAHKRVEDINEKFDFIVSRAVTDFPVFYGWVKNKLNPKNINAMPNGILYLKGGDLSNELQEFENRITIFQLKDYFNESFFETKKVVYFSF